MSFHLATADNQIQIQGDELRVSGKKRDELQSTITFIKDKFDYIPLQYINFRDWILIFIRK